MTNQVEFEADKLRTAQHGGKSEALTHPRDVSMLSQYVWKHAKSSHIRLQLYKGLSVSLPWPYIWPNTQGIADWLPSVVVSVRSARSQDLEISKEPPSLA